MEGRYPRSSTGIGAGWTWSLFLVPHFVSQICRPVFTTNHIQNTPQFPNHVNVIYLRILEYSAVKQLNQLNPYIICNSVLLVGPHLHFGHRGLLQGNLHWNLRWNIMKSDETVYGVLVPFGTKSFLMLVAGLVAMFDVVLASSASCLVHRAPKLLYSLLTHLSKQTSDTKIVAGASVAEIEKCTDTYSIISHCYMLYNTDRCETHGDYRG